MWIASESGVITLGTAPLKAAAFLKFSASSLLFLPASAQPLWLPHAWEISRGLVGSVSGEDARTGKGSLEELFLLMFVQHRG